MFIFNMILNTTLFHPSCYAGLYLVVLQIAGIVLRPKICRPSVGSCNKIVQLK